MKFDFKHIKWVNAAMMYFVIVFGAGFAFGTIRTLWVVPKVGVRTAELMEMPFMVAVTILACRSVVWRFPLSYIWQRIAMGLLSLSVLIGAELFLNSWLTGRPVSAYISDRDPVSGTAYFCALGLFAVMPLLVGKRRAPAGTSLIRRIGNRAIRQEAERRARMGEPDETRQDQGSRVPNLR